MEHICTKRHFDPNIPEYFCCCGCHVMRGAKIVASIYSSLIGLYVLAAIISLLDDEEWKSAAEDITGIAVLGLIVGCVWHGILHERAGYLLPFLFLKVFNMIIFGIAFVMLLLLLLGFNVESVIFDEDPSEPWPEDLDSLSMVFGLIILVGVAWPNIWMFLIMKNARSFILHKHFSTMYGCADTQHMNQGYVAALKED
uniref:Uncharacterized protein n=1 Tax=Plectus sambesii TaxID=2011161 RepID=A0A914X689_9BILA